jgi:hypothetical protein
MGLWDYVKGGGFWGSAYGAAKNAIGGLTAESASAQAQRANLDNQGGMASWFGDQGQANYGALGAEAAQQRAQLQRLANGENSLSREQLRQGLQQNMSAQRSMAASASPQNGPMAALHAAQNMGRLGAGMSGQAAIAGIQERNAAQNALMQSILQQRQQDAQVALGSRQNAISAFGGMQPEKTKLEQYMPLVQAGVGAASLAASDRELKKDVRDGSKDAAKAIEGLRAYSYKYKDEKHGKGARVGIMAQDLEKAGLKHAVVNTREGKMVHGAHLSTANTAMIAELGKRLSKLEGKKG